MKRSLFILIFLIARAICAQESGYLIRNYTPKEYNGFNQTWSVCQDSSGTMYFGSSTNIITFNGGEWGKIFVQSGVPIRSLCLARERVYVGIQGDFGYVKHDQNNKPFFFSLKPLLTGPQQKISDVWKIYEWKNYIIFQTSERLLIYDGSSIRCIEPQTSFALSFCENGRFYVRQRKVGMMELGNDLQLRLINGGEFFAEVPVTGWCEDKENHRIIVAGSKDGLLIYDEKNAQTIPVPETKNQLLKDFTPLTLTRNSDKTLFVTGRKGFMHLDSAFNLLTQLDRKNGLSEDVVTAAFTSSDKNLWLTSNNGISLVEWNSDGVYMGARTGITGSVESVQLFNGFYYVSTTDNVFTGPYVKENQNKVLFTPLFTETTEHWDLKKHRNRLFSASTAGTFEISGKKPELIHNRWTRCLLSAGNEFPYLISLEKGGFSIINTSSKARVLHNVAFEAEEFMHGCFIKRSNGYELWVASISGSFWKFILNENLEIVSTKKYGEANGLKNAQKNMFFSEGTIFTPGNGMIMIYHPELDKGPSSLCFIPQIKFPFQLQNKKSVTFDDNFIGRLWPVASSRNSYFCKTANGSYQLMAYTLRPDPVGDISQYCTDDSLRSWFMGSDFLIYLKRSRETIQHTDYPVNFTWFQAGRDSAGYTHGLPETKQFSYKNNSVVFEFAAPFFIEPEKTEYRCKLAGSNDSVWTKWSNTRHKEYTNLHEGNYTFFVEARNIYGDRSKINSFSFTILSPWYRTWWAYVSYVLFFFVLVFLIVRISIYRLRQSKINLEKIVNERTHELQEKKKEITDSIKYALRIQTAILPSDEHVKKVLQEHFIFYRPKDIVSGDFYWVEEIRGKSLFAAVDCTGHGVPGAMMSVIGLKLLNSAVNDRRLDMPSDILNYLDKGVHDTLRQGDAGNKVRDGMDLALCAWDKAAGVLEYAGVFNSCWLVRKNVANTWRIKNEKEVFYGEHLLEIKSDKMPIGSNEDHKGDQYTNHYIKLQAGDCVYIYSDGYADQFGGPNGKKFKYNKLKELLVANAHLPMAEQQKILAETFDSWKGSQEQIDDVLVMGVRF